MFLPEQHELLLQIIERPADDQLRLVLADRLNEVCDPLGELLTVQCRLERMVHGEAVGDWRALKRREAELVKQHGAAWHQQAAPFARRLVMKRGLPHSLHCSAGALIEDGGLTVLAPIEHLEVEQADAEQLDALFALPLLRRVKSLGLPDLRGLGRIHRRPRAMPANVKRLKLHVDGLRALDAAGTLGLLDHVEELELSVRWLLPLGLETLLPPAAPALKKLQLTGLPRRERHLDATWLPPLRRLAEARPGFAVVWRGLEYDAENLFRIGVAVEADRVEEAAPMPAGHFNREPFGAVPEGMRVDRALPSSVDFFRLPDGALLAQRVLTPSLPEVQQPLSLDATTHLMLEPHPSVLTALAFELDGDLMCLRYERWPCRSLFEVELPLPPPVALAVVDGIARGVVPLRAGLLRQGLQAWPTLLTLDEVLLGHDGAVKLMPPFRNTMMPDEGGELHGDWLRPLGTPLDHDLEGTDDGVLSLLGSALMHLLAGEPMSRRLKPSALDAQWKSLDALVEGCLSTRRSALFASLEAFHEALARTGRVAAPADVARQLRSRPSP